MFSNTKIKKLNGLGISHIILPLLVVVVVAVVGTALLVGSHASQKAASNQSIYYFFSDYGTYNGVSITSSGVGGANCGKQTMSDGKTLNLRMPKPSSSGKHSPLILVCTTPASGNYSVNFLTDGKVPDNPANPQQPVTLSNKTSACLMIHSNNGASAKGVTRTLPIKSSGKCKGVVEKPEKKAVPKKKAASKAKKPVARASGKAHRVFMVGDSISVGSASKLRNELKKHYSQVRIDGSVSRSITGRGITGPKTSGLMAVAKNCTYMKTADTVIIELGTNYNDGFEGSAHDILHNVKACQKTVDNVYWVNVFSTAPTVKQHEVNTILSQREAPEKYTIIHTVGKGISLSPDSIHPDRAGQATFAQIVGAAAKPKP